MMRWSSLLIFVLMATASCAMGPNYDRPTFNAGDHLRLAEASGTSIANLPWWDLLQDEELQQLVRLALAENKDLRRAIALVDEFQARALISKSEYLPDMAVSANAPAFGHKTLFRFAGFANTFNYYLQGSLNWKIDIWGRVRRSNEASRADLLGKEENRRAVVLQLVTAVAYFDLLQYDMQLDIAKRTLQTWEESIRIATARFRQGLASRLDIEQFEAQRAHAAARAAEIEREMLQTENLLSVLVGHRPSFITRGHKLTEQVIPPVVPAGLPSELMLRRPDILAAEQQVVAATARIGVARAARFPKISLTGLIGVASPQLSQLFTDPGSFGVLGVNLTSQLLNGPALGFQQDAVEAQARQALSQYEQTILTAFREVEDALAAVRTASEQSESHTAQVKALHATLSLNELRYKGGLTNYLDVLVVRRHLFEAELALIMAHRLHLVSIGQLYKALGGGVVRRCRYGRVEI